ncbi:MAG: SDR family oxidoreductase [Alphaproteobacteria bacterium]|nr:SDR family oxidoreductase [Alphaproteobacteria bacterium]
MKLEGKTAVLVGCSPNINAGIALELAKDGANVVCADIRLDFAEACAKAVGQLGRKAVAVEVDITDEAQIELALRKCETDLGPVDILLNGAVLQIRHGLLELTGKQFRRQMDVILLGTFLFTKHVAAAMVERQRRGAIINIISTEGHQGNPGNIGYGTAKGGLLNFTRAAAMELAPHGIRVNSMTPTATDPSEGDARVAAWGVDWQPPVVGSRPGYTVGDLGVPLGKRPSPSDYGRAAVFLASDDAKMITGIDLRVDGGAVARYWRWNPGLPVLDAGLAAKAPSDD